MDVREILELCRYEWTITSTCSL